ncbi:MAG: aldo/keto reductase [Paenibacillaceae bacterium]
MRYRQLGHTELEVSEICFGTWPISGHAMGKVDEQDAKAVINHAVDLGINFFDTADYYGFGYAEELLAKTLGPLGDKVIITTKGGTEWDSSGNTRINLSPEYITRACEDSLRRLQKDTIDLYQLHWPDPNTPFDQTMKALRTLVDSGKVRYIGVSNFSVDQISEAEEYLPIVSNQMEYSMLRRSCEGDMIPFCTEHDISFLPYKVLGRGMLTGKFKDQPVFQEGDWRNKDPMFQGSSFQKGSLLVQQLKPIAESHGGTTSQLAIAWVLRLPIVASVVVGAKSAQQIEESCQGIGWDLSENDINEINECLNLATS